MAFSFVDRILSLERCSGIRAQRCFSSGEELFRDHFPGNPIVPGSLLLESLTQAATVLIEVSEDCKRKAVPVFVDHLKYRRKVRPGDVLEMEGRTLEWEDDVVRTDMAGRVGGDVVVQAVIAFALLPVEEIHRGAADREAVRTRYRNLLDGAAIRGFEGAEVPSR